MECDLHIPIFRLKIQASSNRFAQDMSYIEVDSGVESWTYYVTLSLGGPKDVPSGSLVLLLLKHLLAVQLNCKLLRSQIDDAYASEIMWRSWWMGGANNCKRG